MQGAKFDEVRSGHEYSLKELPTQIHWDGELIYVANKRHYQIIDKESGVIKQHVDLQGKAMPMLGFSKRHCLIVNGANQGYFMDQQHGQRSNTIKFSFDRAERGNIVQVLMHEIYVIVVYELSICIFNA